MPTRRELFSAFGLGAAGIAVTPARAFQAGTHVSAPAPWWLIDPLKSGSSLLSGWTVRGLDGIVEGATVLTIGRGSDELRIHICLHDGAPKGYAHSELFDLIVMDQGRGVRTVPKDLAPSLDRLSAIIRDNETKEISPRRFTSLTRLMTHTDRVDAFGADRLN